MSLPTDFDREEFLNSTKYAIAAVNKEGTKIFSMAFFNDEVTEEDFFDLRAKLIQQGIREDFRLRLARPAELNKARAEYLRNQGLYNIEAVDFADKPTAQ